MSTQIDDIKKVHEAIKAQSFCWAVYALFQIITIISFLIWYFTKS